MSESTRDQRMTSRLAPVAFVDLTVPRATEGGKSAKEGKVIEGTGKGKAEEGQDIYGEGGSSGRGGGRGEGKCRHGKHRGKCRKCRGEGDAAGGEGRGLDELETQRREKRARTTQPRPKAARGPQVSKRALPVWEYSHDGNVGGNPHTCIVCSHGRSAKPVVTDVHLLSHLTCHSFEG